jgi:DNA-binding MarR family transcriptional regulator
MPISATSAAAPPLAEGDYRLLAEFRSALREFLHFSEAAAEAAGVSPQQHQVLLVIRGSRNPAVTVGEIALRLKVRHHSAVELVNRMAANRLIKKAADPADGRHVLVELTARAERILRQLSAAHKAELIRVGPAFQAILTNLNRRA